jgi:hypothetical protein
MLKSKKIIKKKSKVKKTKKIKEYGEDVDEDSDMIMFEIISYDGIRDYFIALQNYLNDPKVSYETKINTIQKILSIELYFAKKITDIKEKINYQQKYLWDIPFETFSKNQKVYDNLDFVIKVVSTTLERYYNSYSFVKLLIKLTDTDSVYDTQNMKIMYLTTNKTIADVDAVDNSD